jgi:hypothetical protein
MSECDLQAELGGLLSDELDLLLAVSLLVVYPDRRRPVLSPGYDFVTTLLYIPNDTLA